VAPPGFSPEDDTYLGEMVLDWESVAVGDRNVGAASNDLDLFVWAAEWAETDPGEPCYVPDPAPEGYKPPEYCTTNLARSAGTLPPDRVRFDATSHLRYLLVVNNSTGANLGYTVEISSRYDKFVEPQGVGDTAFAAPTTDSPLPPPPPLTPGGSTFSDDLSPAGGLGAQLSPDPVPVDPDADLAGLQSGGLPGANFLRRPGESTGPPKPVSGVTVALWLALLPVLVIAGAAYWFVRRRPSTLRISFPSTHAA
jgi:hypothetical protein